MRKHEFTAEQRKCIEESCIPLGVYQFLNERVVVLAVSDGLCNLLGSSREETVELMEKDMYRGCHPDDLARVEEEALKFARNGDEYNSIYRTKNRDNKSYSIVHAHGKRINLEDGTSILVTWYIAEKNYYLNQAELDIKFGNSFDCIPFTENIITDNCYDTLTGLPNMSYFFNLLEEGRKEFRALGKKIAVLYFDLIGMKSFNGSYGMEEGDKLLRAVAGLLKRYYSAENCSHLGQDHFAVYTDATMVEETLKDFFEDLKYINNGKSLYVSVGIYIDRFEKVGVGTACDRAKIACDQVKNNFFSNYYYYDEKLRDLSIKKDYFLSNIDNAIKGEWLEVFFQPIIRTASGRVCDEEALVRWNDPEKGMFTPNDFIPVLEDARIIHRLDLYVVDKVLEYLKEKQRMGIELVPVSVNLSRYDFQLCDMVDEICKRVDASGFSRKFINLEITESVTSINPEYIRIQFTRFHEEGFSLWMDDFGSGYSSLNVLKDFEFDLMKFDMRFMRSFKDSNKSRIILTELIQMAKKLGISTITEGVEDEEQFRFVRDIGCEKAQGYYFGKPNPKKNIFNIDKEKIRFQFENPRETPYYDAISVIGLNDPSVNKGYSMEVAGYFNAVPMGILEVKDGKYFIVRYNKAYVEFLMETDFLDLEMIKNNYIVESKRIPEPKFCDTIDKCIKTDQWESVENSVENDYVINSFVRKIATNPETGANAVLLMILSIRKPGR
ncbi:diguanylate cyclase (GGDEF) domain-containing protein [Acetitomaculum ruminis DSM 5522]|uniref:Diguanylate cyclase (GGDEF) domain-containing protein n=1 Tax=Acetitomaculum ruminis DSM 5522 TaxID=1120918 RepID=A0A1I0YVD9_9FIRM|nr:GGDEF and EAL domain-containing protein [Acetitomaculum ruminis]SFB16987.1 diguanylate cyclase (GGDEF) domain-containing protein [Acetitomaculum ruminis DSM 5522]